MNKRMKKGGTMTSPEKEEITGSEPGHSEKLVERQEAVVEELASLSREAQKDALTQAVGSAAAHTKVAAAAEAVKSADNAFDEQEVVREVVRSADTFGAKKAAATEAVKSAENGEQRQIIEGVLNEASSETRGEIIRNLFPGRKAIDRIWLIVVGAFAFVLCSSALALIGAVFAQIFGKQPDQGLAQVLLTVFTTVAGILAGFISGKAVGSASQ
jgi:hypothetical protein